MNYAPKPFRGGTGGGMGEGGSSEFIGGCAAGSPNPGEPTFSHTTFESDTRP